MVERKSIIIAIVLCYQVLCANEVSLGRNVFSHVTKLEFFISRAIEIILLFLVGVKQSTLVLRTKTFAFMMDTM